MVKSRKKHLTTLIINQEQICLPQKLFQSGVNFEIYLSLKWFLPVPVMKTPFTCHGALYKRRAKNAVPPAGGRVSLQPY